jgi:hypothetical protein
MVGYPEIAGERKFEAAAYGYAIDSRRLWLRH